MTSFVDRISTNGQIDWAKVKAESDKVAATAPPAIQKIFDRSQPISMLDYERMMAHINHAVMEREYLLHLAKVCIDQNIDLKAKVFDLSKRLAALEMDHAMAKFEADGSVLAAAGQEPGNPAYLQGGGAAPGAVGS